MGAVVARLRLFPFKSLPGADVSSAGLTVRGGFARDREFALFDERGCVSGKRDAAVHALRAEYDALVTRVRLRSERTANSIEFDFNADRAPLETWLSAHFARPIIVRRSDDGGFPDDADAPGPTVISNATLAAVAAWFPGLNAAGMRARLRTNIEIGGVPAFWEDHLYAEAGATLRFAVGEALLHGTNPCARCVVPARDPDSGAMLEGFAKEVARRREATLPDWAQRARFNHFYRLAVNTRADGQAGRRIRVGDPIRLIRAPLHAGDGAL